MVQAAKAGTIVRTEASSSLSRQREEGLLQSTDDEISRQSANLGHHAHATFIANNPPSLQASHHLKRQIEIAQHPNGAVFANLCGDSTQPSNMRSYNKSTAAQQRGRNTGLHAMQNPVSSFSIESVNSTMSTSSSSIPHPPRSATTQHQQEHQQQQHQRQQTPPNAAVIRGRRRIKKRMYNNFSMSPAPSPATTEALAVVLETIAEGNSTNAVVTRIDEAVEDGMEEGESQDVVKQCVLMQKAYLKKAREDRN